MLIWERELKPLEPATPSLLTKFCPKNWVLAPPVEGDVVGGDQNLLGQKAGLPQALGQ